MKVVGKAERVEDLFDRLESACPDIVLLDWELPGQPTTSLLETIHSLPSQPKVMALSVWPEAQQPAIVAGADSFFCKGDPADYLLNAMRTAYPNAVQ